MSGQLLAGLYLEYCFRLESPGKLPLWFAGPAKHLESLESEASNQSDLSVRCPRGQLLQEGSIHQGRM
jgi:hypothetical protein